MIGLLELPEMYVCLMHCDKCIRMRMFFIFQRENLLVFVCS